MILRRAAFATVLCLGAVMAQDEVAHPSAGAPPILPVGSPAPDFNLPGHCPVAQMYEKRIKQLAADHRDRGVTVVAINPNAVRLSEMGHTDVGDTVAEMKIRAEYRHFNFPYLSDAIWFMTQQKRWGMLNTHPDYLAVASRVNRIELYRDAAHAAGVPLPDNTLRHSTLVDGTVWNAADPQAYADNFSIHA